MARRVCFHPRTFPPEPNNAFFSTKLTEVTFENGESLKIGNSAFGCTNIREVSLPKTLNSIGEEAFGSCPNLASVIVESETPCTLGADAFSNDYDNGPKITTDFHITVPSGYEQTYKDSWSAYEQYIYESTAGSTITDGNYTYELNEDGENTVTLVKVESDGSSYDPISFPGTFEKDGTTYTVTQIGNGEKIFTGTSSIYASADAIPNTVNTIGANAFDGVYFRDGAVIPASVKNIGDGAFVTHYSESRVGPSASSVTLKSISAFAVGEKIFGELDEYFSIIVSEDLLESFTTTPGWDTYKDNFISEFVENGLHYRKSQDGTALTLVGFDEESTDAKDKVVVPAEAKGVPVVSIGQNAFMGKSSLTSLDLSQATNLKVINYYAFMRTSLTEVVIPANVTTICTAAFGEISTLKKVTLYPTDITLYDSSNNQPYWMDQFASCSNLEDVWVPKGTKSTYLKLFGTMANKDEIIKEMDNSITVGELQYEENTDGSYTLVGVSSDFSGSSIVIPSSVENHAVTAIAANAFAQQRGLKNIEVPASVVTIADGAFDGLTFEALEIGLSITFNRTDDISGYSSNMFGESGVATIKVPTEAYNAYYSQLTNDKNIEEKIEKSVAPITIEDDGEHGVTSEMADKTYAAGQITYKRTFSQAGQYGTIALPFDVAGSVWGEYFENVFTIESVEKQSNGLLKLIFKEMNREAPLSTKEAYFVKLKDGVREVTFSNANETQLFSGSMNRGLEVTYDGGSVTPWASWEKTYGSTNGAQYYTFNADGTFGKSDYVVPFRMCLTIETSGGGNFFGAPAFFSIELPGGSTTGINGVSAEKASKNAAIYSIDGKLVRANGDTKGLAKGVYIIGGKKIVVK